MMKLKLLLLFMLLVGYGSLVNAQTTKPYTHLIITEAQMSASNLNYIEFTNMGGETINLSNFEFGHLGAWDLPWAKVTNPVKFMMLPNKELAPGKSFLIAVASDYEPESWLKYPLVNAERVTKPEFYKLADLMLHQSESTPVAKTDSVTPWWNVLEGYGGRETYFLRHHYMNPLTGLQDSTVIDQVGGVFDDTDGSNKDQAYDVAGVSNATNDCVLIRRNSITTGNIDFNSGRGLDLGDSEWIPVPILGWYDRWNAAPWRSVFWTAGNQVNAILDANTLVSKTGKVLVDLANSTITIPWGIRNDDSIMYQFVRKPGLAWEYDYSPNSRDSAYISARTGDKLKLFVCGDVVTIKDFSIIVKDPTPTDNMVIPKASFDYIRMMNNSHPTAFGGMRITNNVNPIDTISRLVFATRIDTLFKYLEKPPKASWKIIYKSGVAKPDLVNGDILRVTSESGNNKDYFIKLEKFTPNSDALLSSITWPDIPAYFKGAIAGYYGWKGDTIPGFNSANKTYVVKIPLEYDGIPALTFTKKNPDSKVMVTKAKNLAGSIADRTVTFTVTAENDTVISIYTVRFDKEKDNSNVQPFKGEPFISQVVFKSEWSSSFWEIANPGSEPLDLSNYMIRAAAWGNEATTWSWNNATTDWATAYMKYIPGRKWQDEANWKVQPRIAIPDYAVNSIVFPGDVFVMACITDCGGLLDPKDHPYIKEVDVNFGTVLNNPELSNPWQLSINDNNIAGAWCNNGIYLYKILNDSVKNGLKPATDRRDFKLIESFGGLNSNNWKIGGFDASSQEVSFTRNSNIYKGNPVANASWGTSDADSEWTHKRPTDFYSFNLGWPWTGIAICTGIGSVTLDEITVYRSTIASTVYKVSPGYSKAETIRGLTTGTQVTGFYSNIIKANTLQTLKVKSAATGAALAEADAISKGDTLIVLSADSINTSKYILDVTLNGLSSNAVLTSTQYTIDNTLTSGAISGFPKSTLLKTVLSGVIVPVGATLTITDETDAYMSLIKLNYDTAYVNVIATNKIYFDVIAENGITRISYQLTPNSNPGEAYVTSDLYSVDQLTDLIQFIPGGTSVHTLLNNVTPAPGATIAVYDKAGFVRDMGDIYRDDKLLVTSADGISTKTYYFSMLSYKASPYLAYVISDDYTINQITRTIIVPLGSITISEFYNKLYSSFGATLKVLDKNGNPITANELSLGDQLLVTAADGNTTSLYEISSEVTSVANDIAKPMKMYPNPTMNGVRIYGTKPGDQLQVFTVNGVLIRDVITNISNDYVSLESHPAGIYIFVISSGNKIINIQKIIKK